MESQSPTAFQNPNNYSDKFKVPIENYYSQLNKNMLFLWEIK